MIFLLIMQNVLPTRTKQTTATVLVMQTDVSKLSHSKVLTGYRRYESNGDLWGDWFYYIEECIGV